MITDKLTRHALPLILVPILLASCMLAGQTMNASLLAEKIIIVDAGHGGIDPGANRPGVKEKDINLAIALKIKESLNGYGAKVILTRESDIELSGECDNPKVKGRYHRDLAARLELVQESDADLFISVHANSSANSQRHGPECFYAPKSAPGKVLANAIQVELNSIIPSQDKANPANYFVLKRNKVPAALIEMGYITNPAERNLLENPEYQQKLSDAVTRGIIQYYREATNPVHLFISPFRNNYQDIP